MQSSLQRLQRLGGGWPINADQLNMQPDITPRLTDLPVAISAVIGRADNRGNPRRPGAMRDVGTGYNPKGTDAMNIAHCTVVRCSTPGCPALVSRVHAGVTARASGRETLRGGDGCNSHVCSELRGVRFQPLLFASGQLVRAAGVLTAERLLIRRPARVGALNGRLVNTADAARLARAAVEAALPYVPCDVLALAAPP